MTDAERIQEAVDRIRRVIKDQESYVEIYLPGFTVTSGSVGAAQQSYREDLKLLAFRYVEVHDRAIAPYYDPSDPNGDWQ